MSTRTARRTLTVVDGPRKGESRTVRADGTTMADLRLEDGTWMLYDRRNGRMESIGWRELPADHPDALSIPEPQIAVTEVQRVPYNGVL